MPRLKSKAAREGSAPEELRNPDHAVWRSARAAAEWLDRAGLGLHDLTASAPLTRHHDAAIMWARAKGLTRVLSTGASWPDWAAMRAAGIPADSGARLVEFLGWAGVTVED